LKHAWTRSNRPGKPAGIAALLLAAWLAGGCASSTDTGRIAPQQPAPAALPEDVQSAARAPFGTEGEALAYGDFAAAGGRHVLVVHRLASAGSPASGASTTMPAQKAETSVDVIRVSILARDGTSWNEAFHADQHLKNRRGYLDRSASPVSAWRMGYEKTPDSGFRLEFTALNLPPGSKPVTVRVAWNPKLKEYDSLDSTGTRFLEPLTNPGGGALKVDR